jgi:hypothetical protein
MKGRTRRPFFDGEEEVPTLPASQANQTLE